MFTDGDKWISKDCVVRIGLHLVAQDRGRYQAF